MILVVAYYPLPDTLKDTEVRRARVWAVFTICIIPIIDIKYLKDGECD